MLHSSETLDRFRRVKEIPGMFIEPINGPFRVLRGVMFRVSVCQPSGSECGYGIKGRSRGEL